MKYPIGSLVRARTREFVVLPGSADEFLLLRPLGGGDDEVVGLLTALEDTAPATFPLPDPDAVGDYASGRLLRDAALLRVRAGAGPFRSFARIAVEPRPYQLAPLLMALRLDPVRLLIADDVGVGKTIEAGLIARELLDRREIERMAVLCPPQLAEQWQAELAEKFHIDATLVLSATATQLERDIGPGESLFDHHPFTVVSMDFIKTQRRREDFLRACPEFVIVDEAHTCAQRQGAGRSSHQRHELLRRLAERPARHMVLCTATPHNGDEGAFRSLLALLDPELGELPEEMAGSQKRSLQEKLARHFIQRKRSDVLDYLQTETSFPTRREEERVYKLDREYRAFFDDVVEYASSLVSRGDEADVTTRIRWWSALALLRAIGSSPAAAAATLRNRAAAAAALNAAEADALGGRSVLDWLDDDAAEDADVTPGAEAEDSDAKKLRALARRADALCVAEADAKLREATAIVRKMVAEGRSPIVFCRFQHTAEYVAAALRKELRGVHVAAVTGQLAPAEREARVAAAAAEARRVLVATDCLSEGVNLQHAFDAVLHYDLAWNPTRHEQREGRVDRYGQPSAEVQAVTLYGSDNPIDGFVLNVLIRKHKAIRNALGVSVSVPVQGDALIEALLEGLLLQGSSAAARKNADGQMVLEGLEEYLAPRRTAYERALDDAVQRTDKSRSRFAQQRLDVQEVAAEMAAVRAAIGAAADVREFLRRAVPALGGSVRDDGVGLTLNLRESSLYELVEEEAPDGLVRVRFELPVRAGERFLPRTHPFIESAAGMLFEEALAGDSSSVRRAGAMRTDAVSRRTTLLLLRLRHHVHVGRAEPLLVEEVAVAAFAGAPEAAEWLSDDAALALLDARPSGNMAREQAADFVRRVVDGYAHLVPQVEALAQARADAVAQAHGRVEGARSRGRGRATAAPQLPADVLGVFVLLPGVK
jgi:superfamily II DNA or RNA helicase